MPNFIISSQLKKSILEAKDHDKIYHDLKHHAHDVKPNDPKAKLIRQNPIQKVTDPIVDTFKDGENFFKASTTGKLNDNSLGRINDLGMKAGALLIASFLASKARTKTDALMQYIGGATFFSVMSLWPKIFINLPARIVHGFKIDHRYISAQGDKKDLGLDNQFQPMDIFSDEEMLSMAKKAGINPKDPRAKEKMQRKLQKTMLQNRTLWMATAGFATPLLTSMVGNYVEPKVRNAVINHGYKKTKAVFGSTPSLTEYMNSAKSITRNTKDINDIFKTVETGAINNEFYKQLSDLLSIDDVMKSFSDIDDTKPIRSLKSNDLISALRNTREELSTTTEEELRSTLNAIKLPKGNSAACDDKNIISAIKQIKKLGSEGLSADNIKNVLQENKITVDDSAINIIKDQIESGKIKDVKETIREAINVQSAGLDKDTINSVLEQLNGNYSLNNVRQVLKKTPFVTDKCIEEVMSTVKADNTTFAREIIDYNKNALPQLRGRLKAYLTLVNNVVDAKRESVYTKEYLDTMKELLEQFDITDPKEIEAISKGQIKDVQELLLKKLHENYPEEKSYIDALIPRPANDAKGAICSPASLRRMEKVDKYKEAMLSQLDAADDVKLKIYDVFGEEFVNSKSSEQLSNFMAHITPANQDWIKPLTMESLGCDFETCITKFAMKDELNAKDLKENLEALFGKDCYLVNDEKALNELIGEIKENKEGWIGRALGNFKQNINEDSELFKNKKDSITGLAELIENDRATTIAKIRSFYGNISENDAKNKLREIYKGGKDKIKQFSVSFDSSDFAYATRAEGVEELVDRLIDKDNLAQIGDVDSTLKQVTDAIIGVDDYDGSITNLIKEYVSLQRLNLSSTKIKAIALANFEDRLKYGDLSKKNLDEATIKAARQLLMDGEISQWYNNGNMSDRKDAFKKLVEMIYDPEAFNKEEMSCPGIKSVIKDLRNTMENEGARFTEKYLKTGGLVSRVKDSATQIFENKAWMKIFGPMTAALIAITLLVQPLFGKIDKEFPENDKKGVIA